MQRAMKVNPFYDAVRYLTLMNVQRLIVSPERSGRESKLPML